LRDVPPETIAEHFAGCGEIDSIRFVFRGAVALVKFVNVASVEKALALNGSDLAGQTVKVEAARARKKRAPVARKPAAAGAAPAVAAAGKAPAAPRERKPRRVDSVNPAATVWVGPFTVAPTEDAIKAALGPFGAVSSAFINKEKLFAFVTFETEASAKKAAAASGTVSIGADDVKIEAQRGRVYVGGLPSGVTEEHVTKALSKFGPVVSAIVRDTNAFVAFSTAAGATAAIAAGSVTVDGTTARVEIPRPRRTFRRRAANGTA